MTSLPDFATLASSLRTGVRHIRRRDWRRGTLEADVYEQSASYVVVFDAPGVREVDVQVRYLDGSVLVRLERFREHREEYESVVAGRPLTTDGRVRLPDDAVVAPDLAAATLTRNGTLQVQIPKTSESASGSEPTPAVE